VAGSCALLRNSASFSTCLTVSTGSETFHSIDVSLGRRQSDARNRLRVNPNWWLGSEQSEDESDELDGITPGTTPGPSHPSYLSPRSRICGEHGLRSANGLGKRR